MVKNCKTKFVVSAGFITGYAGNGKEIGTIACKCCLTKLKKAIAEAEKEWVQNE